LNRLSVIGVSVWATLLLFPFLFLPVSASTPPVLLDLFSHLFSLGFPSFKSSEISSEVVHVSHEEHEECSHSNFPHMLALVVSMLASVVAFMFVFIVL